MDIDFSEYPSLGVTTYVSLTGSLENVQEDEEIVFAKELHSDSSGEPSPERPKFYPWTSVSDVGLSGKQEA